MGSVKWGSEGGQSLGGRDGDRAHKSVGHRRHCCFLKKGAGCGEEGGEETGAGLLEDSMSCAQCIRKVLKTARAPHQTHTAVKQHSTRPPAAERQASSPRRHAHHTPVKQAASPPPVPHTSVAWPRWQCSHPGAPGPLTTANHPWYVRVCPPYRHPTPGTKRCPAQALPLPPISSLPAAPFQVENDSQFYVVSFKQTPWPGPRADAEFSIDLEKGSLGISKTSETWFLTALCPDSFTLPPSPLQ